MVAGGYFDSLDNVPPPVAFALSSLRDALLVVGRHHVDKDRQSMVTRRDIFGLGVLARLREVAASGVGSEAELGGDSNASRFGKIIMSHFE